MKDKFRSLGCSSLAGLKCGARTQCEFAIQANTKVFHRGVIGSDRIGTQPQSSVDNIDDLLLEIVLKDWLPQGRIQLSGIKSLRLFALKR